MFGLPFLAENCPSGYTYLSTFNNCIKIYATHAQRQSDAEFTCTVNNGHLLSIHNSFQKGQILGKMFKKKNGNLENFYSTWQITRMAIENGIFVRQINSVLWFAVLYTCMSDPYVHLRVYLPQISSRNKVHQSVTSICGWGWPVTRTNTHGQMEAHLTITVGQWESPVRQESALQWSMEGPSLETGLRNPVIRHGASSVKLILSRLLQLRDPVPLRFLEVQWRPKTVLTNGPILITPMPATG